MQGYRSRLRQLTSPVTNSACYILHTFRCKDKVEERKKTTKKQRNAQDTGPPTWLLNLPVGGSDTPHLTSTQWLANTFTCSKRMREKRVNQFLLTGPHAQLGRLATRCWSVSK
jgi:hypothetical protein